MNEASKSLHVVQERIGQACARAGRAENSVCLVGAAKTVPAERLNTFLDAGLTDIGENYVQEAVAKMSVLNQATQLKHARWHLIGALQSNKAREAVRSFDLIHSVDRLALAVAIDKAAQARNKVQEVLLQVNVGTEASKAGCAPQELRGLAEQCATLPNLAVRGLMALPPYHDDPEQMRPYFRQLREARDALFQGPGALFSPDSGLKPSMDGAADSAANAHNWHTSYGHLSMGMSNDFEVAIQEGATIVRVGTALFGVRF